MKYTNRSNLPEALARAVMNDPYSSGDCDYSTTTLIKPPRIVALERKHAQELEEDVADRIYALLGQIGHLILERANKGGGGIVEHRFFATLAGKKIGGQIDLLSETKALVDYKVLSIWATKDGVKPEHEQQININAWLCAQNHVQVESADIVAIYRDWSVGEARRNRSYPQKQVQVFPVKLWAPVQQEMFILHRITLHERAQKVLPECTPLERWARGEKWAVMSRGGIKAMRLFDDKAEADAMANTNGKFYVEHRPATQTRCLDYCSCSKFCSWWQDYKKANPQ